MTGPGGRLDMHVDVNYIADLALHRRLNVLFYFDPTWEWNWGGGFQLWNSTVTNCMETIAPTFNQSVIFETNDESYHRVVPVSSLANVPSKSFAAYYYTKEASAHWTGEAHSTIFKARPEEHHSKLVAMRAEKLKGLSTSASRASRASRAL